MPTQHRRERAGLGQSVAVLDRGGVWAEPSRRSHGPGLEDLAQWPREQQDICKTFPGPAPPCTAPCAHSCLGMGVNCQSRWPALRMPRTLFKSSGLSASLQVHESRAQRMAQQALEGNSFSWQKLSGCPLFLLFWMGLVLGMLAFLLSAKRDSRPQRHQREKSSRFEFYKQFN